MNTVRVNLRERSYNVTIGSGLIRNMGHIIAKLRIGRDAVIITNKTIAHLYGKQLNESFACAGLSAKFEFVSDSERAKSAEVAFNLISRIAKYDRKKSIFIVAFGGGVIGDLSGFVSAVYKRGVPYIQIPTTLLAQVDSSIGGKTAIDLKIAKNLVGVVNQPKIVLADIALLETLPPRQIANGLSEIIKYGIIKDRALFEYIDNFYPKILLHDPKTLKHIIEKSVAIKARIVEADEFDKLGVRAILNFGHTIGHAVEAASSYSSKYNHGESVAIGMVIATDISASLGMMSETGAGRIKRLVLKCALPVSITGLSVAKILSCLIHDKKFTRGITRLILPIAIGRVRIVDDVSLTIIRRNIINNMD